MRKACMLCSEVLDELLDSVKPGISTADIDVLAREAIAERGLKSAFLGYYDYPAVTCTSLNQVVVHGIPSRSDILEAGDVLSVDFGAFWEGYCGDVARTMIVPGSEPLASSKKLVQTTYESLQHGLAQTLVGQRLGDVGYAIQSLSESEGCSVVRQFTGHGIGRRMHEEPAVRNYGDQNSGKKIKPGLVVAIEPMLTAGFYDVEILEDDWTAVTKDGSLAAHFEDTVAVTTDGPWVLTRANSKPGDIGSIELRV